MNDYKEYTVTTKSLEDTDSLWDELTSTSGSDYIPSRSVQVANERAVNSLNTSYYLTEEEANLLKNDSRVVDVQDLSILSVAHYAFQDSNFNKTTVSTGEKSNWGLLRHTRTTNIYGVSTNDPGGTYDYVLDGTGVDVVIVDSGIQADHPEFKDAQGNSRVQEIDWYAASGVSGTMPSGFYTDYDGHGTHVAGTLAGKTFGWAKNAHIYSIKLDGLQGISDPNGGMSVSDAFDCILGWHNAKTNGRPTVVNNSWGYVIFWRTAGTDVLSFSSSGGITYTITGGSYRGTPWEGATKTIEYGHLGSEVSTGVFAFPYRVSSVDSDVSSLVNAGIIVCNAAGNDYQKIDVSGGQDYDNYVSATGLSNYYYHRGASPSTDGLFGFDVGSVGPTSTLTTDVKSGFSNAGPGVDVYAAGSRIISAMSDVNSFGIVSTYFNNASFLQGILAGTSMACPQIAGICALLLQAHPEWTPRQVYSWVLNNSTSTIYTTGQSTDYDNSSSLLGSTNRMAYFPMNGQKYYQMVAS